jgi:hypothetical protein
MTLMGLQSLADRACRRLRARRVTVETMRKDARNRLGCAPYWRHAVRINMRHRMHRDTSELLDTLAHEIAHVIMQNGNHDTKHERLTARLLKVIQ